MKTSDVLCIENVWILDESCGLELDRLACKIGNYYYCEDYGDYYYMGTEFPDMEIKMDTFEFISYFQNKEICNVNI